MQIPGWPDIIVSAFDPTSPHKEQTNTFRWSSGGLMWMNNTTGETTYAWEGYYQGVADFGKGNGWGDVEYMCDCPTKIEIGNRIWQDVDGNGVQEPTEPAIQGVVVQLYNNSGTLVGQTTTDSEGRYYFTDANVNLNGASGIDAGTTYYVAIAASNFNGSGELEISGTSYGELTVNDNSTVGLTDLNDSDGIMPSVQTSGITTIDNNDLPYAAVATGNENENIFSFDFGFSTIACEADAGDIIPTPTVADFDICEGEDLENASNVSVAFDTTYASLNETNPGSGFDIAILLANATGELLTYATSLPFDYDYSTLSAGTYNIYALSYDQQNTPNNVTAYLNSIDGAGDPNDNDIGQILSNTTLCLNLDSLDQSGAQVQVNIYAQPTATATTLNGCDDGSNQAQFTLSGADGAVLNGQTGYTVTYHPTLTAAQNGTMSISSPFTTSATTIYARVETPGGCYATAALTLTVNPVPVISVSNDTTICNGTNATLTASAISGTPPYTFTWSHGLGTSSSVSPSPSTTTIYSVTVSDNYNCTDVEQITVTVNDIPQGNCSLSQPKSLIYKDTTICGGIETQSGSGNNWTTGNTGNDDNVYSSVAVSPRDGPSNMLFISGNSFGIPTGSTIEGIEITMKKLEGSLSTRKTISDLSIQLTESGAAVGNSRAVVGVAWPTVESTFTYGGPTDLWGHTWTTFNIDSLGLQVQVIASGSGNPNEDEAAQIDQVCFKIYYSQLPSYCDTDANLGFKISGVTNATNYTWTIPTGAVITAGANTDSITVNFNNAVAAGVQQICVTPSNTCGDASQCCVSFVVEDCIPPCFTIDSLLTDRVICHGENIDTLGVTTTYLNPDSIAFVYFTTQQTDSSIIYTNGIGIDTTQISTTTDTVAFYDISGFTNSGLVVDTYFVYAIVHPTPLESSCRPYQEIKVIVYPCDWGDLPDTTALINSGDYQTLKANNGPIHRVVSGLKLGATIDGETDGQQSSNALGDGTDEDGLVIMPSLNISPGSTFRLPLSTTNTTGDTAHLEAWIDWNGDGDFDDIDEMVIDIDDLSGFPTYSEITAPANTQTGSLLGLRIRLSHTNDMTPYGQIDEGEVEDYLIGVDCPQVCLPVSTTIMRKK